MTDEQRQDWEDRLARSNRITRDLQRSVAAIKPHHAYYRMAGGAVVTLCLILILQHVL
ncbi:MAG: hypothetical protein OXR62_11270 [Ahrensia sp.]|nr:hypothetical protein [Ahrensia sp.]